MSLTVNTGVYALEKPKNKTKNPTAAANTGVILAISGCAAKVQPKTAKTQKKSGQNSNNTKEKLWQEVCKASNLLEKAGKYFLYLNYVLTSESHYRDTATALDYMDTDY